MSSGAMFSEEVVWAKGRKHSERDKYTTFSSSKDWCNLGGLSILAYDFSDFVSLKMHSSDGESYNRYLQIPVDNVEEVCNALMQARKLMKEKKHEA